MIKMKKNSFVTLLFLTTAATLWCSDGMEETTLDFAEPETSMNDQSMPDADQDLFSVPLESLQPTQETQETSDTEMPEVATTTESTPETVTDLVQTSENAAATALTEGSKDGLNVLEPVVEKTPEQEAALALVDNAPVPIDIDAKLSELDTNLNTDLDTTVAMDESETVEPMEEETPTLAETSTTKINESVATIEIAVGSSFDLATLKNNEKYFVKDPEHQGCLTSTTDTDGTTIYTLMIQPGMTTDHFTIFKGHGTQASQTDLRPAFHVKILGLDEATLESGSTKELIEQALKKQEQAEQTFFDDITKRFDDFRKETASIWFDLVNQDDNAATNAIDKKSMVKEHLYLKEGQTEVLATGAMATVQSNKPQIASGKIEHPDVTEKDLWAVSVTGNTSGQAVIRYTLDGVSYKQPIIVQKELVITKR